MMGVESNTKLNLAYKEPNIDLKLFDADVDKLIANAKENRAELKVAEANIKAAKDQLSLARAEFAPSISLNASSGYSNSTLNSQGRSSEVGISINIPIFSGFSSLYSIKGAKEKLRSAEASKQKEEKQISYEVFTAYQNLKTQNQSLAATIELLESANESYKMALGKYKAGTGGILDLLNAQNALADANKQKISSYFSWQMAKNSLAKSLGKLESKKAIDEN